MGSYSSRQLRDNPGPLMRELESGQTSVLTLRGRPIGVVVPFEDALEGGARAGLAVRLLATGVVSLGTAARIAQRTVEETMELAGRLGAVDVFSDEERLAEDLENLRDV